MSELIPRPEGQDATSNVLNKTYDALAEAIPGILASDKKQWALSIGYLFQRGRSGRFLETLIDEWNKYREKGRIKDDYIETEQHQACLQEMLDFLDNDSPDEVRFKALKSVFLNMATETQSDRDSLLPQQLMRICRSLSAGEVIVLRATYETREGGGPKEEPPAKGENRLRDITSARQWLQAIAEKSNLKHPELVETHEGTLMEKKLLSSREHSDRSGIINQDFRLTGLAIELCQFFETEDVKSDDQS